MPAKKKTTKKTSVDPNKIRIADFKIIEGQISSPFEFDLDSIQRFESSTELDLGFSFDGDFVKADFIISVSTISSNDNEATGKFKFVFIYHVENLKELAKLDSKNEIELDFGLANALSSITYSTTRGILMIRFQGTSLESFILPVINPNSLLKL
jgi:hypothetical protein